MILGMSYRFDDIKILKILDLFGDELMDDRLALYFALGKRGQHSGIYASDPVLVK